MKKKPTEWFRSNELDPPGISQAASSLDGPRNNAESGESGKALSGGSLALPLPRTDSWPVSHLPGSCGGEDKAGDQRGEPGTVLARARCLAQSLLRGSLQRPPVSSAATDLN